MNAKIFEGKLPAALPITSVPSVHLCAFNLLSVHLRAFCLSICLSTFRSVHLWGLLTVELFSEMNSNIFEGKLPAALPITSVHLCASCLCTYVMSAYVPSVCLSVCLLSKCPSMLTAELFSVTKLLIFEGKLPDALPSHLLINPLMHPLIHPLVHPLSSRTPNPATRWNVRLI